MDVVEALDTEKVQRAVSANSGMRGSMDLIPVHADPSTLCALVYRSRAVDSMGGLELRKLLRQSRQRNHADGISGLLIFDKRCFFQWIEGPADLMARLWAQISTDNRHTNVELLGYITPRTRMFSQWDMQLGSRKGEEPLDVEQSFTVPNLMLNAMHQQTTLVPHFWRRIYTMYQLQGDMPAAIVIPPKPATFSEVRQVATSSKPVKIIEATDVILSDLVSSSLSRDSGAAARLVAELVAQGMDAQSILLNLFEPAARQLGDRWQKDLCTEFEIVIALCRLQAIARHLGESLHVNEGSAAQGRTVLLTVAPGEQHMLGLDLSLEFYLLAGWRPTCAFPQNDVELGKLLRERHFDVLDISLSCVFSRLDRLPALAKSIQYARAQSQNTGITVMSGGRVFHDHPEKADLIAADACYQTVAQAAKMVESFVC